MPEQKTVASSATALGNTAPSPYHHGNLRQALLHAAVAALAQTGRADFSLSQLARGAGVTPAAAYKHFADKAALMQAVVAHGFEQLTAAFELACPADAPATTAAQAQQRFERLASAYLDFGLQNPALFQLMFGPAGEGLRNVAAEGEPPSPSFACLMNAVADLYRCGVVPQPPSMEALWFAWAAIHGATHLALAHIAKRTMPPDAGAAVAKRLLGTFT